MSAVRPMTTADVPAVAELLARASTGPLDVARLERRLALVLFDHPWMDPALPSLLAEDDGGKLQAFLGVLPRPMRVGERAVRAAVAFRLTIHPECRAFAGTRLLRRFLDGPQDLSLMDDGGCATRSVWERLGGAAGLGYALAWTRPLRPAAWAIARAPARLAALAPLARPAASAVDGALVRSSRGPFRLPPDGAARRAVSRDALLACMDEVSPRDLRAAWDGATLGWALARAVERLDAPVACMTVEGGDGRRRGWYVLAARRGGIAHVLAMAARPGLADDVVREVFHDALARGAVAVKGRVDPRFALDLSDRGAFLSAAGAPVLVHARDAALVRQVDRGLAVLGPLDGAGWLPV